MSKGRKYEQVIRGWMYPCDDKIFQFCTDFDCLEIAEPNELVQHPSSVAEACACGKNCALELVEIIVRKAKK